MSHEGEESLKKALTILILAAALAISGCRGARGPSFRPVVDPELAKLSKEDLVAKADGAFGERRWRDARRYYSHLYDVYPNDPAGRNALLRIADTYFEQGGDINLVEAQYKYRDFINRYPGSENVDYATLQIAMVSFRQMERPDRDQTKTRETIQKLEEMISLYPNSKHRELAETRLVEARNVLAAHEHLVARFYMRRGAYKAALARLNGLVDGYPDYQQRDRVFFDLGTSLTKLGRTGEARLYFERVIAEFPESEYAERSKENLSRIEA